MAQPHTAGQPRAVAPNPAVLAVIAVGGGLGTLARYGVERLWPVAPSGFPYSTLAINLLGSFLLGMLVVAVTDIWRPHRLLRPALGTGVLGGFTTFSTFAVELRGLGAAHELATACGYLAASVVGGLMTALAGMSLVRQLAPKMRIAPTHEALDPFDPEQP